MRQGATFHDPHNPTTPMRVVYDPDGDGVKPRLQTYCTRYRQYTCYSCLLSVISLLLSSSGCTFQGAIRKKARHSQPSVVIAVRYNVAPIRVTNSGEQEWLNIREDFNVIKNLGFQTVLINQTADVEHSHINVSINNLARQTGLNIDFEYRRSEDQSAPAINHNHGRVTNRADMLGSPPHTSEAGLGRLKRRTANPTPESHRSLALIDLQRVDPDPHYSAYAQLLAQYHRSLIAGKVGGIVIEPFHRSGRSSTSLLKLDELWNASDRAALAGLIRRVKCWGTVLYGLYARPLQPTQSREDVDVSVFFRGRRQYLLIFNRQTSRYARGLVVIDRNHFVYPPKRAVELPAAYEKVLGRVVHSREGLLTFSIKLRPGDAVLYELF